MRNDRDLITAISEMPNMVVTKKDGEYRVTYRLAAINRAQPSWTMKRCQSHAEAVAYYTTDREDALGTAKLLSEHMDGIMKRKQASETLYFCKARYIAASIGGREADWSITVSAPDANAAEVKAVQWLHRERPGCTIVDMQSQVDISDPSYRKEA